MLLLVGLGNPGDKYDNNRHNIGFMAADSIARRQNFSIPRERFQSEICEGRLGTEKCLILKPLTFMNLSGQAVGEAMRYFKLSPEDVIVFHDELDIPAGKIKFKTGGGHAGHNGLRSIDQHIGKDYHRIRMGIGHPGDKDQVTGHVLGDFSKKDRDWLEPLLDAVADAAPKLAEGGAAFLNAVGLILKPPAPKKAPKKDTPDDQTTNQ
ncbi:aminoacyl-tRNA hydrolase [Emcibacter sp.]|uniref:aminoacyl-tRNA hydrolase n=1 Tax=Emcibacter sp. TaxID=1979954 RepID=UPI003A8E7DFC